MNRLRSVAATTLITATLAATTLITATLITALGVLGAVAVPVEGAPSSRASPATPAFPPQRPTRVLVLGDSVMKGAATQFAAKLPGREVIVDAEVSRNTEAGADVLGRVGTDWDVVVVLLGHNDGGSPGAFQPAARSILDQLRGVRLVSWLTIHEVRPYYPDVNRFIASLQPDYPNLRIGDWNAVAAAHPEGLAGDGLHLNATGADLMSNLVAEQVQIAELEWAAALQRLATTTTAPPATTSSTTTAPTTTAPTTSTSTSSTTTAPTTTSASTTAGAPTIATTGAPRPAASSQGTNGGSSPALYLAGFGVTAVAVGGGVAWKRRAMARTRNADTAA